MKWFLTPMAVFIFPTSAAAPPDQLAAFIILPGFSNNYRSNSRYGSGQWRRAISGRQNSLGDRYAGNRLRRVVLDGPTGAPPTGSRIPCHFIGLAPDSMRADSEGNVHAAMAGQGRAMIFNSNGFPIGQVLPPERDMGNNLLSTSLAIHPQKPEMRVAAGNTADAPSKAAGIFAAPVLSKGLPADKTRQDGN